MAEVKAKKAAQLGLVTDVEPRAEIDHRRFEHVALVTPLGACRIGHSRRLARSDGRAVVPTALLPRPLPPQCRRDYRTVT